MVVSHVKTSPAVDWTGTITGFNTNTGALSYRPNTNFTGSDSFTFRTSDGTNISSVATVNITVTPVNDAPIANNQSVTTPEDVATWTEAIGQRSYNGVALLSKRPDDELACGLPGNAEDDQPRYIEASFGEVRVASVYLPNGNPVDTDKFIYKIAWMEKLVEHARERVDVGACVERLALELLWRHVVERADEGPGLRQLRLR